MTGDFAAALFDLPPSSAEPGPSTLPPVLAANTWPTNGHLLADVARLHLDPEAVVLDPTYGRGHWWTVYRPPRLIAHDLRLDGVDFRRLPEASGTVDVVAFDPPYVAMGGRTTSSLADFTDRYGLLDAPRTPAELRALIAAGIVEARRVLRPRGLLLVKCCDYVSSGRLQPGTHWATVDALAVGFELVDRFEHLGRPRPQPGGRRQVHARRNLSTLLVLRAPVEARP